MFRTRTLTLTMSSRRQSIKKRILKNCFICPETGCWIWQGADSGNGRGGGYGRMSLDGHTVSVHKVMYTNEYGYVPGKKQIDHTCGNRRCCNPKHLEMVTHRENQRRRVLTRSDPMCYNGDTTTETDTMTIKFFKRSSTAFWLSNFAEFPTEYNGIECKTVEHGFQAAKFWHTDPDYAKLILSSHTPALAKKRGKARTHPIDENWDHNRNIVMKKLLLKKLELNPRLKLALIDTGYEILEENNPYDYYWGIGKNGNGENMMGKLWMEIRTSLST